MIEQEVGLTCFDDRQFRTSFLRDLKMQAKELRLRFSFKCASADMFLQATHQGFDTLRECVHE